MGRERNTLNESVLTGRWLSIENHVISCSLETYLKVRPPMPPTYAKRSETLNNIEGAGRNAMNDAFKVKGHLSVIILMPA